MLTCTVRGYQRLRTLESMRLVSRCLTFWLKMWGCLLGSTLAGPCFGGLVKGCIGAWWIFFWLRHRAPGVSLLHQLSRSSHVLQSLYRPATPKTLSLLFLNFPVRPHFSRTIKSRFRQWKWHWVAWFLQFEKASLPIFSSLPPICLSMNSRLCWKTLRLLNLQSLCRSLSYLFLVDQRAKFLLEVPSSL